MRALISTYDKTGLEFFARGLAELGWELVASGGTAAYLEELGLTIERVEALTDSPEMLGGRVKTLHPRIHAAILARRDEDDDVATLERYEIEPFDLVCVNFYPFARIAAQKGVTEEQAVEMIDVGGPSMLRGAAKNFAHCEAAIAGWFAERESFPDSLVIPLEKVLDLSYGENPHQRAAYYAERGSRSHLLSRVEQLHGKALSFNNLNDLSAARLLAREFALPACVIVKHANPCGVAVGATVAEAYAKALASDPTSAYGGIVVLNREVDGSLGEQLATQFVEVLFAPGYDDDALAALTRKQGTRILVDRERRGPPAAARHYKRVLGGLLVQDADAEIDDREGWQLVCGSLDERQWGDLVFAWRVCKHVSSNAIVLARDLATVGIGAGQMSRVDAVRIAVEKAGANDHELTGSALASDAFFPFPDGPRIAVDAGTTAIVQPGGSRRDQDVIDEVERAGIAMIFTGRRHFRH